MLFCNTDNAALGISGAVISRDALTENQPYVKKSWSYLIVIVTQPNSLTGKDFVTYL